MRDDKYEPELTVQNTKELINIEKVFALFGFVGTPTSQVAYPIALEENTPFLMPLTGATFLREPFKHHIFNFRASYAREVERLINYIVEERNIKDVAIFYQNDSFGKTGLIATKEALAKRGLSLIAEGTYKRNTISVGNALYEIQEARPKAIIMAGTYKPSAEFIKRAKMVGLENTLFCNLSFVDAKSLVKSLEYETKNVIISQVVPSPWGDSIKVVKEYQEHMLKYYPYEPLGFISLEGYLAAKMVVEALQEAKGNLNRKSFMLALETLQPNILQGIKIKTSKGDHQAMDQVYLTKYDAEEGFIVID